MEWTSHYVNDPGDDYELVVEIMYNDKDVAIIRHGEQELELTWYANDADLIVPVEWITSLLVEAKRKLQPSNRE